MAASMRRERLPNSTSAKGSGLVETIGYHGAILEKITYFFGVGVPIFFVISGYCIAATCDSARRRPRAMGDFYLRRFRRIFPPYWIYLGLVAALFGLLAILGWPKAILTDRGLTLKCPWDMSPWQLVGSVFLTAGWQDRLVGPGGLMSGQAWSLCYEEQFYLVSGLLLWFAPRDFFPGVAAVSGLVLALYLVGACSGLYLHGFIFD